MNAAGTFVFCETVAIGRQKIFILKQALAKTTPNFFCHRSRFRDHYMFKLPNKPIFIVNNGLKAGK